MKHRPGIKVPPPFKSWPHILQMQQFDREHFDYLWDLADSLNPRMDGMSLESYRIAVLFDKPSKRTFWSFRLAAEGLGAKVTADDTMMSDASIYKGEAIKSTIDMFMGSHSLFVLRLPEDWIQRATHQEKAPVINAGCDDLQHPTQALIDANAIYRHRGSLDGLKLLVVGNANSRTVRSLAYLLGKYQDIELTFLTLPRHQLDPKLKHYLVTEHEVKVEVLRPNKGHLRDLAAEHDGIYCVRLHDDHDAKVVSTDARLHECELFQITQAVVDAVPGNGFIHHPLPNTFADLSEEVKDRNDSRKGGKVIADQAMITVGNLIRQAVYLYLLKEGPKIYGNQ